MEKTLQVASAQKTRASRSSVPQKLKTDVLASLFSANAINFVLLAEGSPSSAGDKTCSIMEEISEAYNRLKKSGLSKKELRLFWSQCMGARAEDIGRISQKYSLMASAKSEAKGLTKSPKKAKNKVIEKKKDSIPQIEISHAQQSYDGPMAAA